ncbi:MAG: phosphoribosylglycinamide formyltransferase [Vicinamibacterales bacterium]
MSDAAAGGRRLGVLVSGRGSNLQALVDAIDGGRLDATIGVVISNVADAPALARAEKAGLETLLVPHTESPSREAFDERLAGALTERGIRLVCLAGFMRRLSARFFECYQDPVLNVHPALLPAFPGINAVGQAFAHGVKVAGCTVHLVTPELDGGPIVLQAAVPVLPDDTVDTLAARILIEEHRLLPAAVSLVLGGRWHLEGRRFIDPPVTAPTP